ncbi:Co2+/Mg2+ efflux protein ApaG [Xenophilus arseniciresistens]|uniref:Protein ApaG n=1 Tax=Xenophilus arseniciresistens TaxID=1283306 RepID=A0AAE3T1M0_9BURK|nr:Co2+/Mg2+ efflux protein ApaG [Xenophilus arseniciresistens]MDA7418730.1 Co2+/Mg2+ efflux protein ApaG [Xenophilus arseniciresistens]
MSTPPLRIEVEPRYLADQSAPEAGLYTFSYTITVTNVAAVAMQLIARHWLINDASGHAQEVKGLGVVGQQPLLAPGESFRYTSGCRLKAASGTMHGSFFVVSEHGERIDVDVPLFLLEAEALHGSGGHGGGSSPRVLH